MVCVLCVWWLACVVLVDSVSLFVVMLLFVGAARLGGRAWLLPVVVVLGGGVVGVGVVVGGGVGGG